MPDPKLPGTARRQPSAAESKSDPCRNGVDPDANAAWISAYYTRDLVNEMLSNIPLLKAERAVGYSGMLEGWAWKLSWSLQWSSEAPSPKQIERELLRLRDLATKQAEAATKLADAIAEISWASQHLFDAKALLASPSLELGEAVTDCQRTRDTAERVALAAASAAACAAKQKLGPQWKRRRMQTRRHAVRDLARHWYFLTAHSLEYQRFRKFAVLALSPFFPNELNSGLDREIRAVIARKSSSYAFSSRRRA